ncbi:sulfotransferase [Sphingomonas sp.]|uniref:tetratricopeptide repeat-containing sulfotransferase family protein n=1 Tax=Sphingomonas sp. TaxID=28214 RepID=UPI00286B749C|nr:sulfotransferase [Sphingomonas sp.]
MAVPAPSADLLPAGAALADNRLDVAEQLLRAHLKADPFDVHAIRMMAELAARLGRMKDAENLLRRAIEIAPDFTPARGNLALILNRTGRYAEALGLVDTIFEQEPDELSHQNLKAAILGRLGRFDEAIALYRSVLERAPHQPKLWLSLGTMLKTIGQQAESVAAYRAALRLQPTLGELWWSLANLKTVRFDAADIAAMQGALADPSITPDDRLHLDFALGKAMHDAKDHAAAFAHYQAANRLRLETQPYRRKEITATVDRTIAAVTADLFTPDRGGATANDPIFVLGMPRAGSTLVEQILASHRAIEGTGELPDLPAIARTIDRYPGALATLTPDQRHALGEDYLSRAAPQRQSDRPRFVDKLPNNWLHVPLILAILPNATIIDVRRYPVACCLANYRQHFARGQAFTYDLTDVGTYYADYVRLMAHVDAVAPGRVHRVTYERLVEDSEAEIRALIAACDLPFDAACLTQHRTERAIRTPSSEQVRQPIYRDALDEWRPYQPFLDELFTALGPVIDAYPTAPVTFAPRS